MSSPYTATQLESLEKAIASGVMEVSYDGVVTKYHSLGQMIQLRNMMRAELGMQPAKSAQRPAPYFAKHGRGYQ